MNVQIEGPLHAPPRLTLRRAFEWTWLIIWVSLIAGAVAYYAFWQGHFNALRLTGCSL